MTPSDLKLRAVPLFVEGLGDAEIAAHLGLDSSTVATWRAYDAELMQIVRRLRHSPAVQPGEPTPHAPNPDALKPDVPAPDAPPMVTTRMASFS